LYQDASITLSLVMMDKTLDEVEHLLVGLGVSKFEK